MRFTTILSTTGPIAVVEVSDGRFLPVAAAARAAGATDPALLEGGFQTIIEGGDASLALVNDIIANAAPELIISADDTRCDQQPP
jgi:hypothetical protein